MHMWYWNTSIKSLPSEEEGKALVKRVNIQPITAELILRQEQTKLTSRTDGNLTPTYYQYRVGAPAQRAPLEPYYQYRIGPRDILTITVWEHPELTIPAGEFRSPEAAGIVVGEDGTIFYPYAGVISVVGRTVEEVREILTRKLSDFIENVQLDVRVAAYRSQRIYLAGEVAQPGVQPITDVPLTVVRAITSAGGFTEIADLQNVTLTRDGQTYRIDMQALLENGDLSQNALLKHGDVIQVPDYNLNKIFVMGEVLKPSAVIMNKGRLTLAEALGEVGGVDPITSNPARVFVMRSGQGKPSLFHLNTRTPDALILADRFELEPHDVVYVDTAEVTRWNRVISQISPTFQLLNTMGRIKFPLFQGGVTAQ